MSSVRARKITGKLVVFEGPDGVGKSTISTKVAEWLNANGYVCELMTFPGKELGTLGKLVYELHHAPARLGIEALTITSKQVLHVAAHLDAIERRIVPALASGCHVLLDRFWWSTWTYGITGGMNRRLLKHLTDLERAFWGRIRPATVVFIRRDRPLNRREGFDEWRKLTKEYELLAVQEARHVPIAIVDNAGSLEQTIAQVIAICAQAIPNLSARNTSSSVLGASREVEQATDGGLSLGGAFDSPKEAIRSTTVAGPIALRHLIPANPTVVFNTYWRFAAERQRIFFERFAGKPAPWTDDPVLSTYKFTNAYRASDRVSQYLIRQVIYRDDLPTTHGEIFFRILLFKFFNKIETWQLLERELGPITFEDYSFDAYDRVLCQAMKEGSTIYSAAYIMPTGGKSSSETRKHRLHLHLIEAMMADELPKKLADAKSMHSVFDQLVAYPTIGDFLAYQFVTDINYSPIINFSEMEFVVPGPGALDGIRKCFADRGGLSETEIIMLMADIQVCEFERLGLEFRSLWGRPLQLIDCQNLFCEVDKYSRIMHPEVKGLSGRTRIKQRFRCNMRQINYWYPPKWNINDKIAEAESSSM